MAKGFREMLSGRPVARKGVLDFQNSETNSSSVSIQRPRTMVISGSGTPAMSSPSNPSVNGPAAGDGDHGRRRRYRVEAASTTHLSQMRGGVDSGSTNSGRCVREPVDVVALVETRDVTF